MNGFTFDGIHSGDMGVIVNKKDVPMTPPLSNRTQTIDGFDGAWDYGVSFDPREIELECTIFNDGNTSMKDNLRRLVKALNPRKGAKKIVFDDEPDKCYFGRISNQIPLSQLGQMGTFTLQFTCAQMPHTYGTDERSGTFSNDLITEHRGMYVSKPIFNIEHNGGSGSLSLQRNDNQEMKLTFSSDSPSGSYKVDCNEYTIQRNDEAAYQYVSGDFFEMDEGNNSFVVNGNISRVQIIFRDTWL